MADVPIEWLQGTVLGRQEVAAIFNVAPETVTRWAATGMIGYYRKPGGDRCYPESEVRRMASGRPAPAIVAELLAQDRAMQEGRDAEGDSPEWVVNLRAKTNHLRRKKAAKGEAA